MRSKAILNGKISSLLLFSSHQSKECNRKKKSDCSEYSQWPYNQFERVTLTTKGWTNHWEITPKFKNLKTYYQSIDPTVSSFYRTPYSTPHLQGSSANIDSQSSFFLFLSLLDDLWSLLLIIRSSSSFARDIRARGNLRMSTVSSNRYYRTSHSSSVRISSLMLHWKLTTTSSANWMGFGFDFWFQISYSLPWMREPLSEL